VGKTGYEGWIVDDGTPWNAFKQEIYFDEEEGY